jgi:tetratricopeptide (TPR) repeat protein
MKFFGIGLISIGVLTAALVGAHLWASWQWNLNALNLIHTKGIPKSIMDLDCPQIWLTGMIAGQRGDHTAQRQAFKQVMRCSPDYLPLIQAVLPKDLEIAQLATQYYPMNAKAWFWLGEAAILTDPHEAQQAYFRTVALAPHNGLGWCRLGISYQQTSELEKAAEAYLNCCLNADPGKNGCVNAGRVMEQLGDLNQAIEYYRLSQWEEALKRAKELDAMLNP